MLDNCSKCGKETEVKGTKAIGLWVQVKGLTESNNESIRKSLGRYNPADDVDEIEFAFCYECWIDSLFGV